MKASLLRFALLISIGFLSIFNSNAENAQEAKILWDKAPFKLYLEVKDFKPNHVTFNEAANSNYGVPTYALPKNLPVKIISKSYTGGESSYFVQLPDGSLGYIPGYAIDVTRIRYSNDWVGTVESLNGWKKNDKAVGKETYKKYEWIAPEITVKTDKGIKKADLNHVLVSSQTVKSYEAEEDKLISKHVIIIKDPENIKNLVGYDKTYVERMFGKAKSFVGDAVSEVGYAYSYYPNIAIASNPDKYKLYGMAVYYNTDMQVVDAAFLTSLDGKYRKETVRKLKMPNEPGTLCSHVRVASSHKKVAKLPTYDVTKKHQSYEVTEHTYIYSLLRYPEKPWQLGLAAACIALLLAVLGIIELAIRKREFSIFITAAYLLISAVWIYALIIYWPNGLISALIKSFIVLFIGISPAFILPLPFVNYLTPPVTPQICPHCGAENSARKIKTTVVEKYRYITRKDEYIRSTYELIENNNFLEDVANATPYKTVWTSMRQEVKIYQEVRIIEHRERYFVTDQCDKCRRTWESRILERTVRTEKEKGGTYEVAGRCSDVKSFAPNHWEVIDEAKRDLKRRK